MTSSVGLSAKKLVAPPAEPTGTLVGRSGPNRAGHARASVLCSSVRHCLTVEQCLGRPICLADVSLRNLSDPSAAASNSTSLPEDATPNMTNAFRLMSALLPVQRDGGGSPVLCW